MTTKRGRWKWALLGAVAAIAACVGGGSSRRGGLPESQVQTLPSKVQVAYDKFAVRCSRCHTLSRPLNAQVTEHSHWDAYVARMRRHPGSGISPDDAQEILVFLHHYADLRSGRLETETSTGGAW